MSVDPYNPPESGDLEPGIRPSSTVLTLLFLLSGLFCLANIFAGYFQGYVITGDSVVGGVTFGLGRAILIPVVGVGLFQVFKSLRAWKARNIIFLCFSFISAVSLSNGYSIMVFNA